MPFKLTFRQSQRTKPKGLVDLGCAYMYPLHDSFYEKPFCFQLVERALPCLATITYLCSPTQDDLQVRRNCFAGKNESEQKNF